MQIAYSTQLVTMEIQIKSRRYYYAKYYYKTTRMVKVKKIDHKQC